MYILVLFIPLISSITAGLFGRKIGERGAGTFTSCCIVATACISWWILYEVAFNASPTYLWTWMDISSLTVSFALMFDSLTATMLIVVTTVSSLVHIYSTQYMAGDPHLSRFMSYLSLLTFFILILITADNLLQLFIGWEGVGLCSYLLLNFWYTRHTSKLIMSQLIVITKLITSQLIIITKLIPSQLIISSNYFRKILLFFLIILIYLSFSNEAFCMEGKVWDARDMTAEDHARNWQTMQDYSQQQSMLTAHELSMNEDQLKTAIQGEWNLRNDPRIFSIVGNKNRLQGLLRRLKYDRILATKRKLYRKLYLPEIIERKALEVVTKIFKDLFSK